MRKKILSLICLVLFVFTSVQTLSAKNDKGWTTCVGKKGTCIIVKIPGEPDIVFDGRKKRPR